MDWDAIKKLDPQRLDDIWHEARAKMLFEAWLKSRDLAEWARYLAENPPSPETLAIALMLGLEKYEAWQKTKSAIHGKTGAKLRHAGTDDLKAWAYQESIKMTVSDKQKARTLRGRLPRHFEDVSRDPERLIYDHLRAMRKGGKA